MSVTLYSTGCPKCRILETKLTQKNVVFNINNNEDEMIKMGFQSLPMLEVNGELMDFGNAVRWVNGL